MNLVKKILDKSGLQRSYSHVLNGVTFKIPIKKGLGYSNFQNAEPWMSQIIEALGSNNQTLLDAGVNVGQTLLIWKSLFKEAKYVGFEPNTLCVEYVSLLINKNQLTNCTLEAYGLSTTSGKSQLHLLPKDKGDASATTIKDFRKNEARKSVSIETMILSDTAHTSFDIAKIDVEGAELEVIQSIFDVKKDAIIICEILPVYSAENKNRLDRQNQIEAILKENNYSIFRIVKDSKVGIKEIDEIGIHDSLEMSDYIFCPSSKKTNLIAKFN